MYELVFISITVEDGIIYKIAYILFFYGGNKFVLVKLHTNVNVKSFGLSVANHKFNFNGKFPLPVLVRPVKSI